MQKQGLINSVGPIFEVCENDCIRYIATLTDKERFFVPEVAMEMETKKIRHKATSIEGKYYYQNLISNPLNDIDPTINVQ